MAEVGRLFDEGEYYLPEMLVAARAMKAAMEILRLAAWGRREAGFGIVARIPGRRPSGGGDLPTWPAWLFLGPFFFGQKSIFREVQKWSN